MEIGLLIKNYSDCMSNLNCALSYVVDELYELNHGYCLFNPDNFKMHVGLMTFILEDIDKMKSNIVYLEELRDKGV